VALSLAQGLQLVAATGFRARVRVAMVRAAVAVSTEVIGSFTQQAWVKRRQLSTQVLNKPDTWLDAFLAAVAADPNNSLSWFAPVNIASSTNANPIVITTAVAHNLTTGDVVENANHSVNTNANGVWPATVLTSTTFSIPQVGNGVGLATGTIQKQETDANIVFTVNSVFSAQAGLLPGE